MLYLLHLVCSAVSKFLIYLGICSKVLVAVSKLLLEELSNIHLDNYVESVLPCIPREFSYYTNR